MDTRRKGGAKAVELTSLEIPLAELRRGDAPKNAKRAFDAADETLRDIPLACTADCSFAELATVFWLFIMKGQLGSLAAAPSALVLPAVAEHAPEEGSAANEHFDRERAGAGCSRIGRSLRGAGSSSLEPPMAQPRRGIARRAWHERAAAASAAAPSFFDLAALDAAGPKPHEWVGCVF